MGDPLLSLVVYLLVRDVIPVASRHATLQLKTNSCVYRHLNSSPSCKHKCLVDCFKIVDLANTRHCLKLKEAIYISRFKPELNAQLQHNSDFCFL